MPVELAFLGVFPNPYESTREKIAFVKKGLWEPDSEDFLKVVRQSKLAKIQDITKTKNVLDFFGGIVQNEKKEERADFSIARIDLWTHSSPDWIALSGSIFLPPDRSLKPQILFKAPVETKGTQSHYFFPCINEDGLNDLDDYNIEIVDQRNKRKKWMLDDVRKKFSPGAKLVIYSCEAGANKGKTGISPLLKHVAKTMGFKVVSAFTENIKYDYVNGKIFLSVEGPEGKLSPSTKTIDYRALDSSSYFVTSKP